MIIIFKDAVGKYVSTHSILSNVGVRWQLLSIDDHGKSG